MGLALDIIVMAYVLVFFLFFSLIRFESVQRDMPFSWFQLIVAIFWPFWMLWYGWVRLKDWWKR